MDYRYPNNSTEFSNGTVFALSYFPPLLCKIVSLHCYLSISIRMLLCDSPDYGSRNVVNVASDAALLKLYQEASKFIHKVLQIIRHAVIFEGIDVRPIV